MSSEKYINYYIETLVSTLTDCVVRNVSLQANAKVTDEVIQDQQKKNAGLEKQIEELFSVVEESKQQKVQNENATIQSLQQQLQQKTEEVDKLNVELNSVAAIRKQYEAAKGQLTHLDNFRNEIVKARTEIRTLTDNYEAQIKELNSKIESLQKSLKRKKQKETNQPVEVKVDEIESATPQPTESDDTVKDGGSF